MPTPSRNNSAISWFFEETIGPDPHFPGSELPSSVYAADIGYLVDGTPLDAAGNNAVHWDRKFLWGVSDQPGWISVKLLQVMSEEVAAKQLAASFLEHFQVPLANVEWLEQPPISHFSLPFSQSILAFHGGEKVARIFRINGR